LIPIWVWLEFLLKEDPHPEPRTLIIIAIILGFLSAIFSYFVEYLVYSQTGSFNNLYYLISAFLEEFLKFLLIFIFIFSTKYFDEPVDSMIYMGFSAVGFSFIETFSYLCTTLISEYTKEHIYYLLIGISLLRFLGANFLHLLASSIIGFGYSISLKTRRVLPFILSFLCSSFLHFIYNIFIIKDDIKVFVFPILWAVFFIVLIQFNILKIKDDRLGARASDQP